MLIVRCMIVTKHYLKIKIINMNERIEYGKKEIKEIESNVNEVKKHILTESEENLNKKTKIKKNEKFKKEEGIRE
jgi:hypothetical protein